MLTTRHPVDFSYTRPELEALFRTSLKGLEAKGPVTIARTPGGKAKAVDLTVSGYGQAASMTGSCD